jgi:DNA transposition AAA+ family ATPase
METQQKHLIAKEVGLLAAKLSQQKIAIKAGVSAATINHIINEKWDLIKSDIWYKVKSALRIDLDWNHADTKNYTTLIELLQTTQQKSLSIGIAMNEGRSKSHTYKRYERLSENVIYVQCNNYWTKKTYVQALMRAAGLNAEGTLGELIDAFIDHVRSSHKMLIIIDQADKLKDPQLDLFMDFYNDLEGHCAFVVSGVPALSKRILAGVQRDRIGYREMYSRLGRKFIKLPDASLQDVAAICQANGVTDQDVIVEIFNESEGDMRRVRRSIVKSIGQ